MSKAPHPGISKTCVNCGQTKPLSAFLEMSDSHGTAYGNICSSCRKTALETERRKKTEAEGSTTSETGHKIDSKTKVQDAKERRETQQEAEEKYHKERDIKQQIAENLVDKKLQVQQQEQKHRSEFLHRRPVAKDPKTPAKTAAVDEAVVRTQGNEATAQKTVAAHEERKKTEADFDVPFQGDQMGGGSFRFSSPRWRAFCDLLGNSAPIVSNVNRTIKEVTPKKAGAITQSTHQIKDTEASQEKKAEHNSPEEFIEKNWRPGTKR